MGGAPWGAATKEDRTPLMPQKTAGHGYGSTHSLQALRDAEVTERGWRPSFRWGLALVVLVAVSSLALVWHPSSESGRERVMEEQAQGEIMLQLLAQSLLSSVTNVTITTALGGLLGLVENGTDSFLGLAPVAVFGDIPYALPPVGPLRFEPASQWSLPWSDVRDARHRGAQCSAPDRYSDNSTFRASHGMQDAHNYYNWFGRTLEPKQSEDCLNLEVHTPLPLLESIQAVEINDRGDSSLLQPVMLYIHGGHLEWTTPNGALLAGNFSAATNQVAVVLNFREGVMGFLPVREVGAEGGTGGLNGVYDLIVALRWIQDNIHHFGGDPNRVTLYGGSTGGSLVCLLAASPLAAGLFDSVVIASGPCHGLKELLPASVGTAYTSLFRQMLARHLHNMTAEDVDVEYMRSLPAETLIASWDDMEYHVDLNDKPPLFHDANFAFMDGWVLSKRPSTYFKAGQGNMRSAIMGVTSLDGVLFYPHNHTYPGSSYPADRTTWLLSKGEVLKSVPFQVPGFRVPFPREYEEQVLAWTNTTFGVFKQIDVVEVASKIMELYPLAAHATDRDTYIQFVQMNADATFVCCALHAAQAMAEGGVEVHHYVYAAGPYETDLMMRAPDHYLDLLVPPASDGLAGHQAELQMVNGYHNAIGGPLARALAETYTTYIASLHLPFSAAPNLGVWSQWDPQAPLESQPILVFDLPSIQALTTVGSTAERCEFWSELTDSLYDDLELDLGGIRGHRR